MQPRHKRETVTPVRPRVVYFIAESLAAIGSRVSTSGPEVAFFDHGVRCSALLGSCIGHNFAAARVGAEGLRFLSRISVPGSETAPDCNGSQEKSSRNGEAYPAGVKEDYSGRFPRGDEVGVGVLNCRPVIPEREKGDGEEPGPKAKSNQPSGVARHIPFLPPNDIEFSGEHKPWHRV